MLKGKLVKVVGTLLAGTFLALGSQALAQEDNGNAAVDISLTPRVWVSYSSPNTFEVTGGTFQETIETVLMPVYSLTVTISPAAWERTDFLLTGSIGESRRSDYNLIQNIGGVGTSANGFYETDRRDVELLARFQIPESGVTVFVGGRYVNYTENFVITTPGVVFASTGTNQEQTDTDLFFGEVGIGLVGRVGVEGAHTFFGSGMFGAGVANQSGRENRTLPAAIWDLNVGYQYTPTERISLNVRYRSLVIPETTGATVFDFRVFHGPEFGLTFRF